MILILGWVSDEQNNGDKLWSTPFINTENDWSTPAKWQGRDKGSWSIFTTKLSRIIYYLGDLFPKSLMVHAL